MVRPSVGFIGGLFIPTTDFDFALDVQDFRLLWGVSCGAMATISHIPVYKPELLQSQLNYVTRLVGCVY